VTLPVDIPMVPIYIPKQPEECIKLPLFTHEVINEGTREEALVIFNHGRTYRVEYAWGWFMRLCLRVKEWKPIT